MTDVGQVTRFGDKYGDLGDLSFVETMDGKSEAGEAKTITRGKSQKEVYRVKRKTTIYIYSRKFLLAHSLPLVVEH